MSTIIYHGSYLPPRRRDDEPGLRLDAEHQLRRARRPADAADPPLGGRPVHGGDLRAHDPDLLHRRLPQAARGQLADRHHHAHPRPARGPVRLLAARRPAVRRGPADPRGRAAVHPDRRHLPGLLPVRRPVPGQRHRPAAVHPARPGHPRPAPGADHRAPVHHGVPEAHPDAGQGPDQHRTSSASRCTRTSWPRPARSSSSPSASLALAGAFAQINPIWLYGPYNPVAMSAGSQPDFYMGMLEGALRVFPAWQWVVFGHDVCLQRVHPGAGAARRRSSPAPPSGRSSSSG